MTTVLAQNTARPPATDLPPDTIEFAHRMFDAARNGDSTLLLAAVDAGLPTNLTNAQGHLRVFESSCFY